MKYLVGVGIFFVVIVMAIVLLVKRTPSNTPTTSEQPKTVQVTDYVTSTSKIVYTQQGPVVGDDTRQAVKITIDSSSRTIEQLDGYQNKVAKTKYYTNNMEGYRYFIESLDTANFDKERRSKNPDSVGACPLGRTHIFQIYNGNDIVMDRWATSCGAIGTYGGNLSMTRTLFQNQITDYSDFVSGIAL